MNEENLNAEQAPLAEPVILVAVVAFLTLWFLYLAALRQKGIRVRLIPSSPAGKWLLLGQVVVYLALIKGADTRPASRSRD